MKYEMIFGDEKLFDGAPEDCILVVRVPDEDKIFYLENNKSELRGSVSVMDDGVVKLAMRRIIKEPKRWTWEDKEAGRLPEVGALVMEIESQDNFEFVGVCAGSKRFAVKDISDGFLYFYNKEMITPIETPEEKAQREEDEFIRSIACTDIHDGTVKDFFEQGIRAAYRKLKGGE